MLKSLDTNYDYQYSNVADKIEYTGRQQANRDKGCAYDKVKIDQLIDYVNREKLKTELKKSNELNSGGKQCRVNVPVQQVQAIPVALQPAISLSPQSNLSNNQNNQNNQSNQSSSGKSGSFTITITDIIIFFVGIVIIVLMIIIVIKISSVNHQQNNFRY